MVERGLNHSYESDIVFRDQILTSVEKAFISPCIPLGGYHINPYDKADDKSLNKNEHHYGRRVVIKVKPTLFDRKCHQNEDDTDDYGDPYINEEHRNNIPSLQSSESVSPGISPCDSKLPEHIILDASRLAVGPAG
eukprot:gene2417-biopygen11451